MSVHYPIQLKAIDPLLDALSEMAVATARATRRFTHTPRRARNLTLRPGVDTPLWSELARTARRFLVRRGDKAKLARFLGVSRQRLHLLLVAKTRCADAERTLLLFTWVSARLRGQELG